MKNRWYLVLAGVLIVGIVGVSFYVGTNQRSEVIDEPETTIDNASSKAYNVVHVDKAAFEKMDANAFLNAVKPTLDDGLAKSKEYTTFLFDDGTGIYFAFSDITKGGQYANCDEEGFPLSPIGYIDISGTNVTYEEVSAAESAETRDVYQYIDAAYMNDGLGICMEDNVLYVRLYGPAMDEAAAQEFALEFCNKLNSNGFKTKVSSYQVCVNEAHGFKIDAARSNVTVDESVIDSVLEHM